ncbi:MAG TPA: hypothetical protein VGE74_16450 [Gemmata sp.]
MLETGAGVHRVGMLLALRDLVPALPCMFTFSSQEPRALSELPAAARTRVLAKPFSLTGFSEAVRELFVLKR